MIKRRSSTYSDFSSDDDGVSILTSSEKSWSRRPLRRRPTPIPQNLAFLLDNKELSFASTLKTVPEAVSQELCLQNDFKIEEMNHAVSV